MEGAKIKRAALWPVSILVCGFAIHRIADFTPQPLDSSATLRPLLNHWFVAFLQLFAQPETAYLTWRLIGLALILGVCALTLLNYRGRESPLPLYLGLIALSLFVCRFPTLLDYQLNPDEGEFLSAAHKLFYNGNFFQSVDCGTSGPLNIYPLMLPAAFGISPDYASSRLLALAIAFSVICLLYATFRELSSDRLARAAVLPAALVFAGLELPNLVHYSSEQVPLLFIASAIYVSVRLRCRPESGSLPCFLLGLLTGCAFFSKMQSVPIVGIAAMGGILFSGVRKMRALPLFAAGLSCLAIGNAVLCLAGGVWKDFWISYIVSNQRYVDFNSDPFLRFVGYLVKTPDIRSLVITFLAIATALFVQRRFPRSRVVLAVVPLTIAIAGTYLSSAGQITSADSFWGLCLLCAAAAGLIILLFEKASPLAWATFLSFAMAAAALYSVYKPHRLFPHYLLLLIPPLAFVAGLLTIRLAQARIGTGLTAFVIAVGAANFAYPWAYPLLHPQEHAAFRNIVPTVRPPEGDFIRTLTGTTDRIFVWGWTADPYLGSGRVSAARDLNLFYEFSGNPEISAHYQARLLKDLRADPPVLFIDAVGKESWVAHGAKEFGFEQFPELKWFVRANYFQLPDAYGLHSYIRSDLNDRIKAMPRPKHCSPTALRCMEIPERIYIFEASLVSAAAYLPPVQLPSDATLETEVTPMASERQHATIFGNGSDNFRGFQFKHDTDDRYRLLLGLGDRWLSSKPVRLAYGKNSSLAITFKRDRISIQVDGKTEDEMVLPSPIRSSDGPLTIGSGVGDQTRFTGLISFFELR